MADSLALKRVKKHTYIDEDDGPIGADGKPAGVEKTRQEGISLTLVELQTLIDFLKPTAFDRVAFMIGKIYEGRTLEQRVKPNLHPHELEYTVEVLPYNAAGDFMKGDNGHGVETTGWLTIDPGMPFDNDCDDNDGGNQKTPPPSPRLP